MKTEKHLFAKATSAKSLKTLGLINRLSRNDILVTFASEVKRSAGVARQVNLRNLLHTGGEVDK